MVFDFIEGAAGREVAAPRNESAFDDVLLQPRVMEDVGTRTIATRFLGREYDLPFGICPMGLCNLAWPGADRMLARVASDRGAPICQSASSSSTIEDMARWTDGRAWFQVYVQGSVDHALTLVERARRAGCETLVLTVDVPQVSRRIRDLRNGMTQPFRLGARQAVDIARRPRWALATLAAGKPRPANYSAGAFNRGASRAGADWAFLDRLRDLWPHRLIVKGVMSGPEAVRVRDAGADAVWVSNHGGRQLDAAPAAIRVLPDIRAAVGPEYPLAFCSGARSGEDVVRALALGADIVLTGRPWLYAIGAGGEADLRRLFEVFADEVSVTLAQIGVKDVANLSPAALAAG